MNLSLKQVQTLCALLTTVKGLRSQLSIAVGEVKAFFKANRVSRTPENMEMVADIMRVLYSPAEVIGVTAQGSIAFKSDAARVFYFRDVNPGIDKLRTRSTANKKVATPEQESRRAIALVKGFRTKWSKSLRHTIGALLMAS